MVVPSASHRLVFADGLRAFAIFVVVLSHLPIVVPHLDSETLGTWGVNCFFVLSGLLLTGPYLRALLQPTLHWPSARLFLIRRFLRIYPLYAVSVVVSCGLVMLAGHPFPSPEDIASHLLMLQGLSRSTVISLNGPLWTMPVDAAFYLALPALAFILARLLRGRSRRVRIAAVAAALGAVSALGLLWRCLVCLCVPLVLQDIPLRTELVQTALGMAPAFAIGAALAFVPLVRARGPAARLSIAAAFIVAFAAAVALRKLPFGGAHGTSVLHVVFRDLAAAISVGAVVFALERLPQFVPSRTVGRVASWLASLAYAVYLFHFPILQVVLHFVPSNNLAFTAAKETTITLAVTFAVAWIGHRFIEQPFLDLNDRRRERAGADERALLPVA